MANLVPDPDDRRYRKSRPVVSLNMASVENTDSHDRAEACPGSLAAGTPRVLVTGASGFVGRSLVPYLARHGISGVVTGRELVAEVPTGWARYTRGEVLAWGPGIKKIDAIVHLEVRQHVARPSPYDVADFERVNVGNTREWLAWAGQAGVRTFVFLSSIKAVSSASDPRHESDCADADEPYGRSKAAAEQVVRGWASGGLGRAAVILRAAPVYGPGNEANLGAFARQVLRGRPCLVGDGATLKSIVSRTNLAAAIMFTAMNARPGCDVFNVSDPKTYSLAGIAELISRLGGAHPPRSIPARIARLIARAGDAVELLTGWQVSLTTSRLRAMREPTMFPCDKLVAAGFSHPQTTEQGLAEMVAWLREIKGMI